MRAPRETDCGKIGSAEPLRSRRRRCRHQRLDRDDDRTPRGQRGRHARTECAVKARNRSRVAEALPHSEGIAYKPPCGEIARGWGGCGRLSNDGSRQHNSDRSEDPWGGGRPNLQGGARSSARPDTVREYRCRRMRERRTQTKHQSVYAGSRLKQADVREGAALYASLPAVSGKTRRTE